MSRLRDPARKRRLGAVPAEELDATQRAAREVVHWRDELGMVCGRFRLTPDVGVPFVNRLDRATDRARRHAKRHDAVEPWEAHAADAFVAITAESADSAERSRSRAVDLVIVCDLCAWRRGHAHPGEVSHIVGGGPIPVAIARDLARDAFLKAVLHDRVTIHTVAHLDDASRPSCQRRAHQLRQPRAALQTRPLGEDRARSEGRSVEWQAQGCVRAALTSPSAGGGRWAAGGGLCVGDERGAQSPRRKWGMTCSPQRRIVSMHAAWGTVPIWMRHMISSAPASTSRSTYAIASCAFPYACSGLNVAVLFARTGIAASCR